MLARTLFTTLVKLFACLICICTFATKAKAQQKCDPETSRYVVKEGDTLSKIIKKLFKEKTPSNTIKDVASINPEIKNPNLIYTGQTIYLCKIDGKVFVDNPSVVNLPIENIKRKTETPKPAPKPIEKIVEKKEIENVPDVFASYNQVEAITSLYLSSVPNSPYPPYPVGYNLSEQLAFRKMQWLGESHGIEGLLKIKALTFASTTNNISPYTIEGKYHLRWNFNWPWKFLGNFFKRGYYTTAGGLEFYYADQSGTSYKQFLDKYLLAKVGGSAHLDSAKNWTIESNLFFGKSVLNSAFTIDFGFGAHYFFQSPWSVGLNYTLKYIWCTAASDSPDGVASFKEIHSDIILALRNRF